MDLHLSKGCLFDVRLLHCTCQADGTSETVSKQARAPHKRHPSKGPGDLPGNINGGSVLSTVNFVWANFVTVLSKCLIMQVTWQGSCLRGMLGRIVCSFQIALLHVVQCKPANML